MNLDLKNKIAVITGGSVGIGLAVAKALAQEGVHLAICARDEERLQAVTRDIEKEYGVKVIGVKADVSKAPDIDHFAAVIAEHFEKVDILINNAGTGSSEKIMDAPDEKWYYYWDLHVMAAIRTAKTIVPLMKKNGGVIINSASIAATQPMWYEPIYNVTKIALVMLSKCLANELITHHIRVNSISPGLILTPDWVKTAKILSPEKNISWEEYLDQVAKENNPLGRFASPEELANFYVFLCSSRADFCIGSNYYVDGGQLKVIL
ncbi:MAG: SDR family NAD(P)-dependent oxidoreductase [Candidatus Atribacteria bacterium]|nr:SDR family NAD(P)-dependent oxidoreductase [Candidatus Atribacteria bacterium]